MDEDEELPDADKATPEPKEPKKKPVVEKVAAETPAPTKHVHSQHLVNLALHYGFSQADIDSTSPADLRHDVQMTQAAIAGSKPAAEPVKAAPTVEVDEDEEYLAEVDANPDVDPKFKKFLRSLKKKADAKDTKDVRENLAKLEERDVKRERERTFDMIDVGFGALGEKFQHLIGVGDRGEISDPGERGWRGAILDKADIKAGDNQRTISKKMQAAAAVVAAGKIKADDNDEPESLNAYADSPKPKKQAPPKDPATGRFTAEDFERGKLTKPGKKIAAEAGSAVEQMTEYFRQNGDPRGFRPVVEMDEDDLPG